MLSVWYFRAALSQFQGILDLVPGDIPKQYKQIWNRHYIKRDLDSHKLVNTMTRVRDLSLHTRRLESKMENREIIFAVADEIRDVTGLYLKPITTDHFKHGDNPEPEFIVWFNRQATLWSGNALLKEAAFVLMLALNNFVNIYLQYIPEQEASLEMIERAARAYRVLDASLYRAS